MSSRRKNRLMRNAQGQFVATNATAEIKPAPDIPTGPAENADHDPGIIAETGGIENNAQRASFDLKQARCTISLTALRPGTTCPEWVALDTPPRRAGS